MLVDRGLVLVEIAGLYPLSKHLIELKVRSTTCLRLIEEEISNTKDRRAAKNEADLATEIQVIGIEKVRQGKAPCEIARVLV